MTEGLLAALASAFMLGMLGLGLGALSRCALGFHEHPMLLERARDEKGRPDPYAVHWRCPRCMKLATQHLFTRAVARTEMRPNVALKTQIHRDRKAARVLEMRRRA